MELKYIKDNINNWMNLSDDELYTYIQSLDYKNWQDLYSYVNNKWFTLHCEYVKYQNFEEEAEKIGAIITYKDDVLNNKNYLTNEYNKWSRMNNILQNGRYDKSKICKHDWQLWGCRGYDREIDVYKCTKCGAEKEE